MDAKKIWSKAYDQFKKKKYDAALKTLDKLQKSAPNYRDAYYLEAEIWEKLKNPVRHYLALKKILPLINLDSPQEAAFHSEFFAHFGEVCDNLSFHEDALHYYNLTAEFAVDKKGVAEAMENSFFTANAFENFSRADFDALYERYRSCFQKVSPYPKKFYDHEKIRIGFLSGDFRFHPIINWSWSLLSKLDKNLFETYFYSNVKKPDNVTDYLRKCADVWRDIQDLEDEQAAKIIHDDEIDILFDLSGHTQGTRLRIATYRPASVQMSGVGYMNSTGLDCFDYFLSDVFCAGDENYFVEKLIRLPHSHICYEPPTTKLEPAANPPCLKNGYVTFGSFNQFKKMTDSILIAWKKILDAVPDSKLFLKTKIFNTEDGRNFVGERLKRLGFDLARIEMRPYSQNWILEYNDVDIALDTFPYTGGVTTCEALYMGVPVISLYGDRHGSRFGLSILSNIGLEELAVASYDEYINRAVMLASDWELLTLLRKNLRTMMKKSPLMNSENYLHEIQEAFIKILDEERRKFNER